MCARSRISVLRQGEELCGYEVEEGGDGVECDGDR
jgi:hypothetical protein